MIPRKPIRESVKKEICYRQSYKCAKCSNLLPPSLQIDHIIPYCISQNNDEDNLQVLCPNCHSLKSQKEILRISQYKKILKNCSDNDKLCWFCLETYTSHHHCDKTLKDIPVLMKTHQAIKTSFEEMCAKYKYVKRDVVTIKKIIPLSSSVLKICINMYNKTINVNHVIVKFTEDELSIEQLADAVFLATRTKTDSKRYTNIEINIDTDDEDGKQSCYKCIDDSDFISRLPERIFRNFDEVLLIFA